jgi:hypothetical protein
MKPTVKKAASGRTMRVATVFTGAAACAAAFTPATAAAGIGHHAVARPGHQLRLDVAVAAADRIRSGPCSRLGSSADLRFKAFLGRICFGYAGIWTRHPGSGYSVSQICGGNNFGSYGGYSKQGLGSFHSAEFRQGSTYVFLPWAGTTDLTYVNIQGWHGSKECGLV